MNEKKIGLFISKIRKEQNLTQKEISEKLQVSPKTISRWETGRGLPEVSQLLPLSNILNISVNELLAGETENSKEASETTVKSIKYYTKKITTKLVIIMLSILLFLIPLLTLTVGEITNFNLPSFSLISMKTRADNVLETIINDDYDELKKLLNEYNNGRFGPRSNRGGYQQEELVVNLKSLEEKKVNFTNYKLISMNKTNIMLSINYKLFYTYNNKEYYINIIVGHMTFYDKTDTTFYAYNAGSENSPIIKDILYTLNNE